MFRPAAIGAFWAIVLAFPVAGVFALVYRFPIPFTGYLSGPSAVGPAMMGVFFYGIIGGFAVLAGLGALVGAISQTVVKQRGSSQTSVIVCLAIIADAAVAFMMSILDKLIGPW